MHRPNSGCGTAFAATRALSSAAALSQTVLDSQSSRRACWTAGCTRTSGGLAWMPSRWRSLRCWNPRRGRPRRRCGGTSPRSRRSGARSSTLRCCTSAGTATGSMLRHIQVVATPTTRNERRLAREGGGEVAETLRQLRLHREVRAPPPAGTVPSVQFGKVKVPFDGVALTKVSDPANRESFSVMVTTVPVFAVGPKLSRCTSKITVVAPTDKTGSGSNVDSSHLPRPGRSARRSGPNIKVLRQMVVFSADLPVIPYPVPDRRARRGSAP